MGEKRPQAIWGYIEGYYGRLFGWDERTALVDHLAALSKAFSKTQSQGDPKRETPAAAGAYLYAPKEDSLHRRDWRIRYPAEWRKRFRMLAERGMQRGVDVVPGMAPGLSYDYLSADDYRVLLSKLRDFQRLGCRTLALLMDDIQPVLPRNCRKAFSTLGEAHGLLLQKLYSDLRATGGDARLWFCPTVYTDQFAAGPVEKDAYLSDLAATMPKAVTLMWTGPRIVSKNLEGPALATLAGMFGGNVVLWDNLYANDYCPNKIFLGPFAGRTRETWSLTRGLLLNPTGLPATDKLLLDLLADNRRGLPPGKAWRAALTRYAVPKEFLTVAPFLASPFFIPGPKDLAPKRVAALRAALKKLIWDWKGVLHQEWYPFLFMLDADLKASEKGEKDADWVRKRYSPLIARLILKPGKE